MARMSARDGWYRRSAVSALALCALLSGAPAWARDPGTWGPAGALGRARAKHSATVLADGRVLVIGGVDGARRPLRTAEVLDPATGARQDVAPALPLPASGHTATRLADGSVLVAGGTDASHRPTAAAQVFDASSGRFVAVAPMSGPRRGHTATLLADGRVVIAGGENRWGALDSLEVYDPATRSFALATAALSAARLDHTATLLDDGSVLLAGGSDGTRALTAADVYEPGDGSVTPVWPLTTPRARASAALLPDGSVLVAGGHDGGRNDLDTAEVYVPALAAFVPLPARMSVARSGHAGLALPGNGRVLIAGGTSAGSLVSTVEAYDPVTGAFVPVPPPATPRQRFGADFVTAPGPGVMIATGGLDVGRRPLASAEAFFFPTLWSDREDYQPGEVVTLAGAGWMPGEQVRITVHESSGDADTLVSAVADVTGSFTVATLAVNAGDIGVRFLASAAGETSAWTAQARFTDGAKISSVSIGSQSPRPVTAGNATAYVVTVKRASGTAAAGAFEAALALTTALPAGATPSFSPNPIAFSASENTKTSVLTISTLTSTPAGRTTIRVTATNPALAGDSKADTQTLDIAAPLPPVKLAFATVAFTGVVGQCSPAITIQTRDSKNVPAFVAAATVVTLTSSLGTGGFFADAACATPIPSATIAAGTHSVNVFYRATSTGRPVLTASTPLLTSASQTETIGKASTSVVVGSSANPSAFGQPVTLTATVSVVAPGAGTPTGTVQFKDGGAAIGGPVAVVGGRASVTLGTLSRASHVITAVYSGDVNLLTSTSPGFTQTVDKAATAVVAGSTPNGSVFGQSVTLSATVSVTPPGAGSPTGTVQFKANGAPVGGTVTLVAGAASLNTTGLAAGAYTLTAEYSGDASFAASVSPGLAHVVGRAATSTLVGSSQNPSVVGRNVTFTATVTAVAPGAGTPAGLVQFRDGGAPLGAPVALTAAGTASVSTTALSAGGHTVTAEYAGDGSFAPSVSGGLSQFVSNSATTTAVVADVNPSVTGQVVTFTATVSPVPPSVGAPTGTVQFSIDGAPFGAPVALVGATAAMSTGTLAVGGHSITATYNGDANFNPSTSPALSQAVNPAATTAGVTASVNPSPYGSGVTFTATVTPVAPGAGTPTGTVQFKADGVALGAPVALSGGSADTAAAPLALVVGVHTITAEYGGDASFLASTGSASHTVRVPTTAEATAAVNQLRADTTVSPLDDRFKPNLYKTTDKAVENLTDGQAKLDAGDVAGAILKFQSAHAYVDLYHKTVNDLVVKGDVPAAVGAPLLAEAEVVAAQIQAIIGSL